MLRYVVERMEDRASVHQLTLAINTDSALPTLTGDDDLLEKAFTHLVDNAIRYTPAHGRVTLHARAAESELVVEIEDSGIGIAQADLPHIFERFHRADDAHSTRGFGLGLPIVQKIVEGHGGRITVESEPGVGTTFRVFLPIMSVPVME
jgi:signal transduction histidine kinase